MKRLLPRHAALGLTGILAGAAVALGAEVTSIDFKAGAENSQIEIRSDSPITVDKQENAQDKQIVLELKGASLSKLATRKIPTSEFNSKVVLISPYQVEGEAATSRVVIQLKDMAQASLTQDGNVIRIQIPTGGADAGAPPPPSAPAPAPAQAQAAAPAAPPALPSPDEEVAAMPAANSAAVAAMAAATKSENTRTAQPALDEFQRTQTNRQFTGRPITLQVRDTELADVFRLIGEASGFNIIMGDDVKGKITVSLVDVPWDQALDVILNTKQLGAERQGSVLKIVTLANLTAQKQQELQAKVATESVAPRVTRVFPVNYANLEDLQATLSKFNVGSGVVAGAPAAAATFVQADKRTNSLVIRDIPDNIERMRKLIELLDTQTPQVLIEAKIIEASEGFTKTLGGSLGVGNRDPLGDAGGKSKTLGFGSFGGLNPVDPLFGSPGVFANGTAAAGLGNFGISPSLSILGHDLRLNALIHFGETENKLKLVASPRTVVLNRETANILQSTPVLVSTTTVQPGVGTVLGENIQQANLSLNVSPTVTNEGSVLMNLTVTRDLPQTVGVGKSAVGNRNMTTKVLVDSGSTLVIGGIYTQTNTTVSSGFPILRKIPVIGWLFGEDAESSEKSELFFFITPRILNVKEAGIPG